MSMVMGFVAGASIGAAVATAVVSYLERRRHTRFAAAALEEGFRTFIEHHVNGLERDSEAADERWEETVSKKRMEKMAREMARSQHGD